MRRKELTRDMPAPTVPDAAEPEAVPTKAFADADRFIAAARVSTELTIGEEAEAPACANAENG